MLVTPVGHLVKIGTPLLRWHFSHLPLTGPTREEDMGEPVVCASQPAGPGGGPEFIVAGRQLSVSDCARAYSRAFARSQPATAGVRPSAFPASLCFARYFR